MAKKDTIKKNKSTKKSSFNILALPKNIISEIAILIKSIGVGVFGVVDMIISFIVSFCSYLIWGVKNIIEAIWNFCFKSIWGEIYILAVSIYEGAKYIITISFYDLPLFLYNKCSKYVYDVYNYIKRYIETIKEKIEKEKKEETQTLSQKL